MTKQILIVDDKSELLHLMRRVLEDEQYQVSILQDGNDAFTTMKATLPDPDYYQGVRLIQKPFELQHLLDTVEQVVNEPVR